MLVATKTESDASQASSPPFGKCLYRRGVKRDEMKSINRRQFAACSSLATAALVPRLPAMGLDASTASNRSEAALENSKQIKFCLNMSTINNREKTVTEQVRIAAEAGYDSVELWVRDIDRHVAGGGKLSELASMLNDNNLTVESAIAFGKWIVNDESERRKGLEQSKRDMATLAEIGGIRIAAPPVGATKNTKIELAAAGERYAALLDIGKEIGVIPQIELWGFSENLSTLQEVLYVAAAAGDEQACVLLDVYHMYKGGSDFSNVGLIPAEKMHCLHMNDYPADPVREKIGDADRVYPGRGVAPLDRILKTLLANGFTGAMSLELFNREYWKQDAFSVAVTGLRSMKDAVRSALNS